MRNILMFPGWFPSKLNPLNAIFTKKHIDVISEKNNVVVVYAIISETQKEEYTLTINNDNSYAIVTCSFKKSKFIVGRKVINFYRSIKAYFLAIEGSKKFLKRVDFIHVHVITRQSIIALYFKYFKNIQYFISEHSTEYLRGNTPIIDKKLKSFIAKNSLGLSSVSMALKTAMINEGVDHKNFLVIHNVISKAFNADVPNKAYKDKTNFLHVSRLDESAKNVIGILKCFDKLYDDNSNIELHIVGGTLGQISEAEIYHKSLKSRENIFFHGLKFGNEVLPFFRKADYLVMFSNYETQAVVILESLFCGIPVIATDLECLNEYLHSGNSIQVRAMDNDALLQKMRMCVDGGYDFWNSEKIASEISMKFHQKEIGKKFEELYSVGLLK